MADPDILGRLSAVTAQLTCTILSCPVGASATSSDAQSKNNSAMPTLVELCRMKKRLDTEILQHKVALKAGEDGSTQSDEDHERLSDRINILLEELEEHVVDTEIRQSIIDKLSLGRKLLSVVMEAEEEGGADNPCARSVRRQVHELTDLSSNVLTLHQHIKDSLMPAVETIKTSNLDLKHENRKLMEEMQQLQGKKDHEQNPSQSAAVKEMEKQVELQEARVDVMRHVLQGLVLGSGVDWAADDDLKDTVLSLGQTNEACVV